MSSKSFFPSEFSTKLLYIFLIPAMHVTFPTHLVLIILVDSTNYEAPLYTLPPGSSHFPFLGPYILSSTLNLCSSHYSVKDSNTPCKAITQYVTEFLNYICMISLMYLKTLSAVSCFSRTDWTNWCRSCQCV